MCVYVDNLKAPKKWIRVWRSHPPSAISNKKKRECVCVREKKRESAWEKWGWKVEEYRANRPANNGHCGQRWAYRNKGSTVVVLISKYLLTLRSIYWTWTQIFLIAKKKMFFFSEYLYGIVSVISYSAVCMMVYVFNQNELYWEICYVTSMRVRICSNKFNINITLNKITRETMTHKNVHF